MANLLNDNGANTIDVTLSGDVVWNVTGTSVIATLTIAGDAQVIVSEEITLTVNGVAYTNCTLDADSQ